MLDPEKDDHIVGVGLFLALVFDRKIKNITCIFFHALIRSPTAVMQQVVGVKLKGILVRRHYSGQTIQGKTS